MLTKAQVQKYIQHAGVRCPFCWSYNISSDHFEGESMSQPVECRACGKRWHDIYKLVDAEEIEDDPQLPEKPCDDGSIAV